MSKHFQKETKKIQKKVWGNKKDKDFNTTDVPLEFCLLEGEVTEAFESWRENNDGLGEELADIAIYLFGLSQMVGIDLGKEIIEKMNKNKDREYKKINGVSKKV
ncbi:MAG: MazG-like family protein [Minisyncoccales bacterium]